jgi:hypothetical protein
MALQLRPISTSASLASGNGLLPLMQGELQLAAEPNPSRLCPLAPFISADLDQVPFERREAAENCNH